MVVVTAVAQPQGRRGGMMMMMPDYRNPDSTATVIVDRKNGCRELCHAFYKYNTQLTRVSEPMKDFLLSVFR